MKPLNLEREALNIEPWTRSIEHWTRTSTGSVANFL